MSAHAFERTHLWLSTLAPQLEPDPDADKRELLRTAFLLFRDRAALLGAEIARDLSEFTVHDVTHLDALWEMGDLAAGPSFALTPPEAFVLGGAFLIHDLGMGLAAYPEGKPALRSDKSWPDTVAALLRSKLGRTPTPEEIASPPLDVETEAFGETLRNLHARQAASLALTHWHDPKLKTEYHLIESPELRERFGKSIGNIAYSHWWSVDELKEKLTVTLGSAGGWPNDWTVDQIKLACLLRIADASHIDARRAPAFLRALRKPHGIADAHWTFQQKLNQPRLHENRLEYTTGSVFPLDEAPAWWLCRDTLEMIDGELRHVDALLADTRRPRLAARGVAGIDDPSRLTKLIPTEGWKPVETRVRVTDVPALVERLGGAQLYGDEPTVPLRELIQNASDAVRARRLLESRADDWGEITVRLGADSNGPWLEVEDTGIGMSAHVLTGALLDFGTTYWGSWRMRQESPGLLAKGFSPTGRFGIGFFSVFMWGQHVRVTTRRAEEARRDTRVLEFSTGLAARPILRPAVDEECIRDGGTRVRVWLKTPPDHEGGLLWKYEGRWQLDRLCEWLCPALDTNLSVDNGVVVKRVVSASDWITMDGAALVRRICDSDDARMYGDFLPEVESHASKLRLLTDDKGRIYGRVAVAVARATYRASSVGVVTVGGLRADEMHGITGVLVGICATAARNVALPSVSNKDLASWASEQALIFRRASFGERCMSRVVAPVVHCCGGDTSAMPIARTEHGWVTREDIGSWNSVSEILLVDAREIDMAQAHGGVVCLGAAVLAMDLNQLSIIGGELEWPRRKNRVPGWNHPHARYYDGTFLSVVLDGLASAWGTTIDAMVAASNLNEFVVGGGVGFQVGTLHGEPYWARGISLRNPKHASAASVQSSLKTPVQPGKTSRAVRTKASPTKTTIRARTSSSSAPKKKPAKPRS